MSICTNCGAEVKGNYCASCGQPATLKKIDGHYLIHEMEHILHFDRGILHTIKELILRPGAAVKGFLTENRGRLVKPIIFIIVTSLIYSVINHLFHIEDGLINFQGQKDSVTMMMFTWAQNNYGYANIFLGIFVAFFTRLFFKKYSYNFFEIMILLCYVMGIGMLIFALAAAIQGLVHVEMMQFAGIVGFGYIIYAIGRFFDGRKISSYIKALAAYFLGMLMAVFVTLAIGLFIDLVILK